jgi:hypothetical protein
MADRPLIVPSMTKPLIGPSGTGAIVIGTMASNIFGPVSVIDRIPGISYDIQWTGTPTGTFTVQVSNSYFTDPQGNVIGTPNWTNLPSSSFSGTYPIPSGSAGAGFLDVVGTEAYAVRLIYTAGSGSGTLTVYGAAKVL